jgi:hypothetical protein
VAAGHAHSVNTAADDYTYGAVSAPTVTKLDPSSGPEAGGDHVTITGSGFSGASGVRFGATAASSYTVIDDGEIHAIAPAGTGTVNVTVTTQGGTSTDTASYTYVATARPGAPTGVSVVATASRSATVKFDPPAPNGSGPITGYQATCGSRSQTGSRSPITVAGLTNGTTVSCTVRARNAVGYGPYSAGVAFRVGVPWRPTSFTAAPGAARGSIALQWNAARANGAPVTGYTITCEPINARLATKRVTVGGSVRSTTITGLHSGERYHCSIVAANVYGSGPPFAATPLVLRAK